MDDNIIELKKIYKRPGLRGVPRNILVYNKEDMDGNRSDKMMTYMATYRDKTPIGRHKLSLKNQ